MHSSDIFGIFTDAVWAKKEFSRRKRMRTARMKDVMIDNIMITCPKCENVIATHDGKERWSTSYMLQSLPTYEHTFDLQSAEDMGFCETCRVYINISNIQKSLKRLGITFG